MEKIEQIPLQALRESPFNPRKTYPQAELQELAESIKSQGVMQPIVARPLPDDQTDIEHTLEIVFGHRRFRAAQLAGLECVPVVIRDMTDEQAAVAQVHENAKRQDVTAFEEADSFQHLNRTHGMSADAIAAAIGKSRSYVYGRLKLAVAGDEVRQACIEQGLPAEIALEISRIRNVKLQAKALKEIQTHYFDAATMAPAERWMSYRSAKYRLQQLFRTTLTGAIFDITVSDLTMLAGACTTCPKRAGNDPDLQDLDPNTCTDRSCFDEKTEAWKARQIQQLRKSGHQVLEGDQAKAFLPTWHGGAKGYTGLTEIAFDEDDGDTEISFEQAIEQLPKKAAKPKPVYLVNPHDGKLQGFITDEDADQVLQVLGKGGTATQAQTHDRDAGASSVDAMKDWTEAERKVVDLEHVHAIRVAVIQSMLTRPRTLDDLRAMAHRELDLAGDFGGLVGQALGIEQQCKEAIKAAEESGQELYEGKWYGRWIDTAPADVLGTLLAALAIDDALSSRIWPRDEDAREKAAKRIALVQAYGVDVLSPAAPASAPSTAARADDEADDEVDEAGSTPPTAARAPAGVLTKGKVRYRNELTGETWSGRGLMPKWLKAATADGKTLADFEVASTPSPAARAAGGAEGSVDAAAPGGHIQAGFAGKDDEGAGSAVASDAAVEALEATEA